MKTHVHIACDEGTSPYANYAFDAMKRLSSDPTGMELHIHVITREAATGSGPVPYTSYALERAFRSMEQSQDDLHVICDSDTVVLWPLWDVEVLRVLETYDCFGTSFQDIGSRHARNGKVQLYKGKPTCQWMALKPGKPWHRYRVVQNCPNYYINSPDEAKIFGLPVGYELLQDTMWNFPKFLAGEGLTSLAMKNVDRPVVVADMSDLHEEWHHDGFAFVVHQRDSRRHKFRRDNFSQVFYNRCDQLLAKQEAQIKRDETA